MLSTKDTAPLARAGRLKRLIAFMGMTRTDLARALGCSLATISYWENAKQGGLQKKGAQQLADFALSKDIVCTVGWLMEGAGELPKIVQKGEVVAYLPKPHIQTEELGLFLGAYLNAITFVNNDNGMLPYYQAGDIIGCVLLPSDQVTLPVSGEIGVVTINDDPQIRVIKPGETPETYNLHYIFFTQETKRAHQINGVKLEEIGIIKRVWRK